MDILIRHPALALVPVLLFVMAYFHHRVRAGRGFRFSRFVVLSASVVWLLYTVYEFVLQRAIRAESVPIRVDLLVIYPALLFVTACGAAAYAIGFRARNRHTEAVARRVTDHFHSFFCLRASLFGCAEKTSIVLACFPSNSPE